MARAQKIRLGIVFGGRSSEHEVSLNSAASVISALNPEEYEITVIGVTKKGKLASAAEVQNMLPPQLFSRVRIFPPKDDGKKDLQLPLFLLDPRKNPKLPEIIFPLLHGPYGEDGTIQGLLEMLDLPYIGCGVLASAVGMDKDVTKRIFLQSGLPVAPFRTVLARDLGKNLEALKKSVSQEFGYPMFSKPANLGSSVGVYKIRTEKEFEKALAYSALFDRKILIEKGIDARELECAILGNDDARASVVGEIIPAHEFYDYEAKYLNPASRLEIPARIDKKKTKEVRELALRAFKAIDGSGLARVDFFMERSTGKIWINEINTMPGFTPISMYAKLWAASGISFEVLVRRLIQLGIERFEEKSRQKFSVQ